MAWGVEGFAVSFIAPHSLTARALVVAPNDTLTIHNRGRDVVDVIVDGRPMGELSPGDAVSATFRHDVACLAQAADSSFYRRGGGEVGGGWGGQSVKTRCPQIIDCHIFF